jgi:hypothetical protein
VSKPKISTPQYFKAAYRIMDNESGLLEKVVDHFHLDDAQLEILRVLEERRQHGEFTKKAEDLDKKGVQAKRG